MKQEKINTQIEDVVDDIIDFFDVNNSNYYSRKMIRDLFTEKIEKIYSRGYSEGINSERSSRKYK